MAWQPTVDRAKRVAPRAADPHTGGPQRALIHGDNAMAAYILANVKVTDATRYERYKQLAQQAVERYGGRYLVRGGETAML